MSDIALAIWMLGAAMVGAAIGTVVMSVLAASRRADKELQIVCDVENCTFIRREGR